MTRYPFPLPPVERTQEPASLRHLLGSKPYSLFREARVLLPSC